MAKIKNLVSKVIPALVLEVIPDSANLVLEVIPDARDSLVSNPILLLDHLPTLPGGAGRERRPGVVVCARRGVRYGRSRARTAPIGDLPDRGSTCLISIDLLPQTVTRKAQRGI